MNAMRFIQPTYHRFKECQGCTVRDENKVAAHILSFQLVDLLLKQFSGEWKLTHGEIVLFLEGVESPLRFDLNTGTLHYGSLSTSIVARYSSEKGLAQLLREVSRDFSLPLAPEGVKADGDQLFTLFAKLIEIFHARCGLRISPVEQDNRLVGWELSLSENGPRGWISSEGIAENRFGERVDIKAWYALRPEKMASSIFGFNQFCSNYPSPIKSL